MARSAFALETCLSECIFPAHQSNCVEQFSLGLLLEAATSQGAELRDSWPRSDADLGGAETKGAGAAVA